jgi:Ca-activated chloride channel family protein
VNAAEAVAVPWALPLLAAAPLAWWGMTLASRRAARRRAAFLGPRAERIAPTAAPRRAAGRRLAWALALLLATFALVGPLGPERAEALERHGVDLVVCLDVSRSMLAQDVAPSRLGFAQAEIAALAARATQDRLGLVVYAGEARAAVPLTADRASLATVASLADPSSVTRGGTDLGAALDAALALLEAGAEAPKVIVVVSDGEDHVGRGREAAERARARGVRVFSLGLGTARGAKIAVPGEGGPTFLKDTTGRDVLTALDPAALEGVAASGGGAYATADAAGALSRLHDEHVRPLAARAESEARRATRTDLFWLPLLPALLLGCLACWLGGRGA